MLTAIIIFCAVYIRLAVSRSHRALITWIGIAVALALGALRIAEIVPSINWNVLGIFAGTLVLAELFIISKIPETIADILVNRSPNLGTAFLSIIAFVSVLSMFVENVTAMLPVVIQFAREMGLPRRTLCVRAPYRRLYRGEHHADRRLGQRRRSGPFAARRVSDFLRAFHENGASVHLRGDGGRVPGPMVRIPLT